MKGLRGVPRSRSSWTMELKGLPDGSRLTRCHSLSPTLPQARVKVKTFEMLDRKRSGAIAAARHVPIGVDHDKADCIGVDARQFGNIGRDFAPIRPTPHLVGYIFYDSIKIGHWVSHTKKIGRFLVGSARWFATRCRDEGRNAYAE
jgi:hypothetical protein